jgi:hypothetical protein
LVGNRLDIVHHGKQLPLCVHLGSASELESTHALVLEVGKDSFNGLHALAVDGLPLRRIKRAAHAFGGRSRPHLLVGNLVDVVYHRNSCPCAFTLARPPKRESTHPILPDSGRTKAGARRHQRLVQRLSRPARIRQETTFCFSTSDGCSHIRKQLPTSHSHGRIPQ